MAEIGYGYGSEYQLLRMLGHHRNFLNSQIQKTLGTNEEIKWADYPVNDSRISLDGEWKGIDFIFRENKAELSKIKNNWKNYWPSSTNSQNWDGIFKVGTTWYFVEAKAHAEEVKSQCKAESSESRDLILNAFEDTKKWLKSSSDPRNWLKDNFNSYQLANRLAFINFCKKNNINAKLFYISFVNGYSPKNKEDEKSIKTTDKWNKIWEEEYKELGICKNQLEGILYNLTLDCLDDQMNVLFLEEEKGLSNDDFCKKYPELRGKSWNFSQNIQQYQEENKNYCTDAFKKELAQQRYNKEAGEEIEIKDSSEEKWKCLSNSGYTNYAVSSLGRVAFKKNGKYYILKQDDSQTQYYLRLVPDESFRVDRTIEVYKLIAMGFLGKTIGDGFDVHHIYNDGYNCRPENLILLTRAQHNAVHLQKKFDNEQELIEFLESSSH